MWNSYTVVDKLPTYIQDCTYIVDKPSIYIQDCTYIVDKLPTYLHSILNFTA